MISGCGKTSLLAALSLRLRDELSADIRFNGEKINRERMTQISGFLPQSDVTLNGITVREHLFFMVSEMISTLCYSTYVTHFI